MTTHTHPGDFGCEVYSGNADVIGAAVSVCDWEALRNGTAAHAFVGFPPFVWGGQFDSLAEAVASVLQEPEVPIRNLRMVAGEDGNWSADVLPADWVGAMASVPEKSIGLLARYWSEEVIRIYADTLEWSEPELRDPLYRLTVLCREAISRRMDVVLLTV